ncbi:MAG: SigE family RNA polymerase sigma factor [Phycicoccus sp.]
MSRRDDGEFTEFVRASSPRLLRLAWMLTGSAHAAEDLVQAALERLYVRWSRLDEGGRHAYARRVVVNLHTDTLRRRSREHVSDRVPERAVEDTTEQHADAERLRRALAHLPARERQCVVLRHHGDLSEREVADLLHVSTGTVKSSTSRGLARLRELLVPEGELHV